MPSVHETFWEVYTEKAYGVDQPRFLEKGPRLATPDFLPVLLEGSDRARRRMAGKIGDIYRGDPSALLRTLFPLERLGGVDILYDHMLDYRPFLWVTDRPAEVYIPRQYYHAGTLRTLANIANGYPLMGSTFLADRLEEGFFSSLRLQPLLLKPVFELIKGKNRNFSLAAVDLFAWFGGAATIETYLSNFTARCQQSFGYINKFLAGLREFEKLSNGMEDRKKKQSLAELVISYTGLGGTWAACAFSSITQDLNFDQLLHDLIERITDLAMKESVFDRQFGPPDPLLDSVPVVFAIDPGRWSFAPVVFSARPGAKLLPAGRVDQSDIEHIWVAVDNPEKFALVQSKLVHLGYPAETIKQRSTPAQNTPNCMVNYQSVLPDQVIDGERPPSLLETLQARQSAWENVLQRGLIAPLFGFDPLDEAGRSLSTSIPGVLDEEDALRRLLRATRSSREREAGRGTRKSHPISWPQRWRIDEFYIGTGHLIDYSLLPARIV